MPSPKGVNLIDGLASVRALRHADKTPPSRPGRQHQKPVKTPESRKDTEAATPPARRIGHTTTPKRFEIDCYECGYRFQLTGHLQETSCPKCHKLLELFDRRIDGPCDQPVKTMGTVEITSSAEIKDTTIKARHAILAGDASRASLHAQESIEIRVGARFDESRFVTRDLSVGEDAQASFERKMICRDVKVEGHLRATLYADGVVDIGPQGFLEGEVHTPRLVMYDGAGLKAKLVVGIGR